MAEDGSPKIYFHCPTEKNKTSTEATLSKSETTITSEVDHISSVNDYTREHDFSSTTGDKFAPMKGRLKSEDDAEICKSKSIASTEKEMSSMTVTNSKADDFVTENFISTKISNNSSLLAAVSLIDFSANLADEDILLDAIFSRNKDVSKISKVSGELKKNTTCTDDTPTPLDEKDVSGVTNSNSSDKSNTDEVVQVTNSFIPEDEISSSTKAHITTIPDITTIEEEKITESDLVVSEDSNIKTKLTECGEENFITVFELTVENDKDNPEDIPLRDEKSVNEINIWTEGDGSKETESHSVLLTAVESKYDFVVSTSVTMNLMDDSPTTTMKDLFEKDRTESVSKIPEPSSETNPILDTPFPIEDTPNHLEDSFTNEMDLFKLLEDPDGFMI
ncbi:PREDICTED: calcium-binding and spermatid-specific protein 1 [Elephantulus edwardii]|uniref:calcium-binding and spermatid-specific protein 1 n=1 Tax=Elephantulus edwardii TaxID=28737 RepID=UPI0003F093BC|nr:PREDICTED: calcium-binding and spermatid-specific protein 1 [Elephantulus edwardii]